MSELSQCQPYKHSWYVSKTESFDPDSEAEHPSEMTCFRCGIVRPYDQSEYYHWNDPDWKPPQFT